MSKINWVNRNPNSRKDRDHLPKIDASHFPSDMTIGKLDKETGIRAPSKKKNRWTNSNSFEAHGETFWIVKKTVFGKASNFYHAYNVDTRNHIIMRETKSEIMTEIMNNYMDYMRDDF